nr:uncharacterized protein CI109_002679 [Kwoniella shandongensis]KAA5528922.1 hypothetical protein CI109_002679 [Kwoniella shandongensis]
MSTPPSLSHHGTNTKRSLSLLFDLQSPSIEGVSVEYEPDVIINDRKRSSRTSVDIFTFLQETHRSSYSHTSSSSQSMTMFNPKTDHYQRQYQSARPWSAHTHTSAWWLDTTPELVPYSEAEEDDIPSPLSTHSIPLAEMDVNDNDHSNESVIRADLQIITLQAFLREEEDDEDEGGYSLNCSVPSQFVGCGGIYGRPATTTLDGLSFCPVPSPFNNNERENQSVLEGEGGGRSKDSGTIDRPRAGQSPIARPVVRRRQSEGRCHGETITFEEFLSESESSLRRTKSVGKAWKRAREVWRRGRV